MKFMFLLQRKTILLSEMMIPGASREILSIQLYY